MDVDALRVLLSVVVCGSIQGASRALGLPRSQLRRRLDALEAEVGVSLLHRDAEGARLTAAGHVVVERGRAILHGAERLVMEAREAAGEAAGVLRVFEPIWLPLSLRTRCLLAMRSAMPRLRFVVRQVEDPIAHLDEPCDLQPPRRADARPEGVVLPRRGACAAARARVAGLPRVARGAA